MSLQNGNFPTYRRAIRASPFFVEHGPGCNRVRPRNSHLQLLNFPFFPRVYVSQRIQKLEKTRTIAFS